jgi:hypothetical protein
MPGIACVADGAGEFTYLLAPCGKLGEGAKKLKVMVGPKLCSFFAFDGFQLADAVECPALVVLPTVARCDLIGQILKEVRGVSADYHWPAPRQLDNE